MFPGVPRLSTSNCRKHSHRKIIIKYGLTQQAPVHHHELLEPLVEHAHLLLFEAPENLLHGVGLARSNLRAQPSQCRKIVSR